MATQNIHIHDIHDRDRTIEAEIKSGAVLTFLQKRSQYISDVELASALSLSVPLVRAELGSLLNQDLIKVQNQPSQGKLHSGGLQYKCIDQ